jgi:low affinity Fe/Cu permease
MQPSDRESATFFDRFADWVASAIAKAPFFFFGVILVVLWAASYPLFGNLDTWQLVINTSTTILTFLMVALLQNAQKRTELAIQAKLNVIADGLADFMEFMNQKADDVDFSEDIEELKQAVGLEEDIKVT